MAQSVFVYFPYGGSMCEANILNQTWSKIPSAETFADRKLVLATCEIPFIQWPFQGDVENPEAFGRQVDWS